jgi:hypothetical protein
MTLQHQALLNSIERRVNCYLVGRAQIAQQPLAGVKARQGLNAIRRDNAVHCKRLGPFDDDARHILDDLACGTYWDNDWAGPIGILDHDRCKNFLAKAE